MDMELLEGALAAALYGLIEQNAECKAIRILDGLNRIKLRNEICIYRREV
jgi:hypothetical protein